MRLDLRPGAIWVALMIGACSDAADGPSVNTGESSSNADGSEDGVNPTMDEETGVNPPDGNTTSSEGGDSTDSSTDGNTDSPLNDEFDGSVDLLANNTTDWAILHPERAASIDIGQTIPERLTIVSENGPNYAWFEDHYGPLVYRDVTGNFAVIARLRVVDNTDPSSAPTGNFNSGGFVIRDPAGTHQQNENWVMYNFGRQGQSTYSREFKKTEASLSRLFLNPQEFDAPQDDTLLVCRIDDTFHFFHRQDGQWEIERVIPDVTISQGNAEIPPELDQTGETPAYFALDLPDTVQVGVMAHAWQTDGANDTSLTRAEIDYVRFADVLPTELEDCTASF